MLLGYHKEYDEPQQKHPAKRNRQPANGTVACYRQRSPNETNPQ